MEKDILPDDPTHFNNKMDATPSLKASTPLQSGLGNVQYGGLDPDTKILIPGASKKSSLYFQYLKTLTIEPVVLLYLTGYIMNLAVLPNMVIDKGCLYYYNYSIEICSNMSHYKHEKEQLEILANNYMLYCNLTGILGAIAMILIAPWSDKYGRKPPLLAACFGMVLCDVGFVLCSSRFDSDLFYLVLSKIPSDIFGGIICVLAIVFSHASEVSSKKTRTRKYATVELCLGLTMAVGGFIGGTLQRYYGYLCVYVTATVLHCVCLIWIFFCVQETRGLDVNVTWNEKVEDFFKIENLSKGWKATVKRRERNGRTLLLLFYFSMCFIVLTYESFGSIAFTYVHNLYDWDPMTASSVDMVFSIFQMVILVVCIPLLVKIYRVTDYTLGIMGTISMIGKYCILGFSYLGVYVYYAGNTMGGLSGMCPLAVRSAISKLVEVDELGRIFSFLATCESVFPLVGTLVLTKVFNATIEIHPSITYLMTAAFLLLPAGTFIWAYLQAARRRQYAELRNTGKVN